MNHAFSWNEHGIISGCKKSKERKDDVCWFIPAPRLSVVSENPTISWNEEDPKIIESTVTLYCNLSNFWRELKSIALGLEIFMKKRKLL